MGLTDAQPAQVNSLRLSGHPSRHSSQSRNLLAFLALTAPALILFAVMMLWPLVNMFHVSTLEWNGLIRPSTQVGLDNYGRMLSDRVFHQSLINTAIHAIVAMGIILPLSFMLGFFLSLRPPGYRILRTIYFSPAILSVPALSMVFLGVYLPDGIVNQLLRLIGLESWTRIWLADPSTALGAVIAVDLWGGIGFYGVLFFTALSNIPRELYEAARIDGANYWTIMWRIAFPYSIDFFGVMAMLLYMWILLGAAQNVLLLTKGRPGISTMTLGYYLYDQAFEIRRLGYSQAIAVFIFFVGLLGMLIIRTATRRRY